MKELLKKYLAHEDRCLQNQLRTETDDVEKLVIEGQIRLIDQIWDDFELEEV